MTDNEVYTVRAQQEIERAAAKAALYRGGCKDCVFRRNTSYREQCGHPAVAAAVFNATNGGSKKYLADCEDQRNTDSVWGPSLCGPNGALFEHRDAAKQPLGLAPPPENVLDRLEDAAYAADHTLFWLWPLRWNVPLAKASQRHEPFWMLVP